MAGEVSEVSDADFDEKVLKSSIPVLVDFWAPWCAPCKSIAPALDEVAKEFAGKILIAKVNVDNNPMSPAQYNVRAIPNLVLFKGGAEVNRLIGAVRKEQIVEVVEKLIAS